MFSHIVKIGEKKAEVENVNLAQQYRSSAVINGNVQLLRSLGEHLLINGFNLCRI